MQLKKVRFECDAKVVVVSLQSNNVDLTEFGDLISKCRDILKAHTLFYVVFVRRSANMVAYLIARRSCSLLSPYVDFS
ncbi:hypothetical protein LINPERPRIM_LOCUS17443 [Linum perenne]